MNTKWQSRFNCATNGSDETVFIMDVVRPQAEEGDYSNGVSWIEVIVRELRMF